MSENTNKNYNNDGGEIMANIIMYMLKHDSVITADIAQRFKLSLEITTNIIKAMCAAKIIAPTEINGLYKVIVKSFEDIDPGVVEFLNMNKFNNIQIADAFKTLTTEEKDEVSLILREDRDWEDATTNKPDLNIPVVIRMVNKNIIYNEDNCEVLYAEDMKIGKWNGEKWNIIPPYPKYDYSPISKFGELNEGTIVSHWAPVAADELEGWNTRFNRIFGYNLKIEVDPDWEEQVYRALMWGAAYIAKFGGPDFKEDTSTNGLRKMYEVLCDMQACMDSNIGASFISMDSDIMFYVDNIILRGSDITENGTYDFSWNDIKDMIPDKTEFNNSFPAIIKELSERDEITDVYIDYTTGTIQCSIDPIFCPNYEWEEGDEEVFGMSKEEWENSPTKPIKYKTF